LPVPYLLRTLLLSAALWMPGCGLGGDRTAEKTEQTTSCADCPDCAADASCPQSFCEPRTCVMGKCQVQVRDCSDGVSETWDRCDGREQRCHHYLGDGIKSCTSDGDCSTDHGCQEFTCSEGLCRATEESRNCGSVLLRPLVCEPGALRDHCEEAMRWKLSYTERSLVLLVGGPACEGRAGEHSYCEWGTDGAVPADPGMPAVQPEGG